MTTSNPPMAVPMMTLCTLSATAPNPRPSGETIAEQEARILLGINTQLAQLGSDWVANWLVLTQDRANLAYIATEAATNSFAVVLRGTQFNSLVDLAEDMMVGNLAQFTVAGGTTPLLIAKGTMNAFTEITNAVSSIGSPLTNVVQQLQQQFANLPSGTTPNLYVTGHSLGGCMATTMALYLWAQSWATPVNFYVYTYAAPSAGLQAFASYYDSIFPSNSWRVYNQYDVVPNAWATLMSNVYQKFYPAPGPAQTLVVSDMIKQIAASTNNNTYVQTNAGAGTVMLNPTYGVNDAQDAYDAQATCATTGDFFAQLAFQHANNTYLQLLQGQTVPDLVPSVNNVLQNTGPVTGGTMVIIFGTNFSADCVVDFGTVPATSVQVVSPTQIDAVAPPLSGTVDVCVTNFAGTSPAVACAQFTAPAPTLPPTVTAISPYTGQGPHSPSQSALSPNGGPAAGGTTVTVSGTGFRKDDPNTAVAFGATAGTNVQVVSLTQLTVVAPPGTGTVDVTVTNSLGTSATSSADRFTYGPPVVTSISPRCGQKGTVIKISGAGFAAGCSVQFGESKSVPPASVSPTTITVAAPDVLETSVDVRVNVSGNFSPLTKSDVFTYTKK
ncbi:MAG TPA: IPT/TIG domain-containing protein [Thermoanaerobaculia bacterium]|nr:IPT/TIG domain-containing protein [Thermoanaerobaculia bacterium]